MRYALRFAVVFGLLTTQFAFAQTQPANEIPEPFLQPSSSGVSASITDEPEDEERGFTFPKVSFPKLPKPNMPKLRLPSWKMPKFSFPKFSEREPRPQAPTRQANQPSAWDKFNNGTKSFFVKTRDTLMPWASPEVNSPPQILPESRMRTASRASSRSAGTRNTRLFPFRPMPEPDENRADSPSDFILLPQTRYD